MDKSDKIDKILEINSQWKYIKSEYDKKSLSRLKSDLNNSKYIISDNLRSRHLIWMIFLCFKTLNIEKWIEVLKDSRNMFDALIQEINPNCDFEDEDEFNVNNNEDELSHQIYIDICRLYPSIPFFRESHVKKDLFKILYIWSKLNPDTGYRQGMHEILAPIYWVLDQNMMDLTNHNINLNKSTSNMTIDIDENTIEFDENIIKFYNKDYLIHDTFLLFRHIMIPLKQFYEINDINNDQEQSLIISHSNYIQNNLLKTVDPFLSNWFQKEDINSQIWGIRWLRLMFSMEFNFDELIEIWDGIFINFDIDKEKRSPKILDMICVVMLIRMRGTFFDGDQSTIYKTLLNYPTEPDKPITYINNSIYLLNHTSPLGGKYIIEKYRSLYAYNTPPISSLIQSPNSKVSSPFDYYYNSYRESMDISPLKLLENAKDVAIDKLNGGKANLNGIISPFKNSNINTTRTTDFIKGLRGKLESIAMDNVDPNCNYNVKRRNEYDNQNISILYDDSKTENLNLTPSRDLTQSPPSQTNANKTVTPKKQISSKNQMSLENSPFSWMLESPRSNTPVLKTSNSTLFKEDETHKHQKDKSQDFKLGTDLFD